MRSVPVCAAASVLLALCGPAWAGGSLFLESTFETGQVQDTRGEIDGFYIQTVPQPQVSDEYIKSSRGGFGPETSWDTRVVRQETVNGEDIRPRQGRYFLRSAIYNEKNYQGLNGGVDSKPRQNMVLTDPSQRLDFDEEAWIGFSIFLPSSWEHEQGVNDHRGGTSIFVINAGSSASFISLTQYVPTGESKAHWFLKVQTSDSTATESGPVKTEFLNLGSVEPDLGKWTDFVVRARANPFTKATNPARAGIPGSKDQMYEGNRGILQVWKSHGEGRTMKLLVDRVNTPVGMVPLESQNLLVRFQMYKYGWRRNPTTVKGPVWVGFDEIRYGTTDRHGTGYADVVPMGQQEQGSTPKPPAAVKVD